MTFSSDLARFAVTVRTRSRAAFLNTAEAMLESITVGSPVTGSPGQPVDTGFLSASWQNVVTGDVATIGTNVAYAPVIEFGTRAAFDPRGQRNDRRTATGASRRAVKSTVGGVGSVRATVANADLLLRRVVADLGGGR